MQVKYDYFNMPQDPQLFICNANNHRLSPIVRYTDSSGNNTLKITVNYNRTSELTIQVYKFLEDAFHREPLNSEGIAECYQYISNYKQIHVQGLGYFIITQITMCDDGFDPYIDVKATSCEIELNSKGLVLAANTYQFWDATTPSNTILGKILSLCPRWSIGTVSPSVSELFRTFDDISQNVYNFMMNDIENAFSCICDFDIENRKINIIDMHSEIPSTDILLTYDNVLNDVKLDQPAENIITALNVSGGSSSNDTLDIRSVNPIGGNVVYKFDYFMNLIDMDQSLIDAINAWQTKISNNQSTFSSLSLQIQTAQATYSNLNGELSDLNAALASLKQIESVATTTDYPTAHAAVVAKQAQVDAKQIELNNQQVVINNLVGQLNALQVSLSMSNNFTLDQYITLNNFIHQVDYKDENIITIPSMTYAEKQAQAQELYDKALLLLNQRCIPTSTIEIDCQNFILMPEFDVFRSQIELGKIIHVELNRGNIVDMMLLQYEIEYNNKTLKIAVSNRTKLHDLYKDVQDWQTQLQASASTMSINKADWNYPMKSGFVDSIDDFTKNALNLSKNELVTDAGQKAVFDSYGYHGFKTDPSTGVISPKQIWIKNNSITMTTDNWATIKAAFGEFTLSNGTVVYGFNGETIVAGKIMSPTNPYVYFDLNNGILAASKLTSSTLGATDVYANIGTVNWSDGTTSKGLGLFSSEGVVGYFNQTDVDALGRYGLEISSLGKIQLRCSANGYDNKIIIYNDQNNQGHAEIWRRSNNTTQEEVFNAYNGGTDIYARNVVWLHTNTGNMSFKIKSDGFHFGAGIYERALIDSEGYKGWINGYSGADGDITDKNGDVWHFKGGILVG